MMGKPLISLHVHQKTIFLNGRSDIQGSVDLQLVDLPAGRDYKVVTANGWETRFIITA